MKKPFLTILAVLIVVDVIAMTIWFNHKKKSEEKNATAAAVVTPVGPPPETRAEREPEQGSTLPPMQNSGGPNSYSSSLYGPGISPGGCGSIGACEEYCMRPENEKECLEWTQGDQKKKRDVRESQDAIDPMFAAIQTSDIEITPGDCQGAACATYCKSKLNRDECVDYCSRPKNHSTCKKWKGVSRAIRSAVSGSLVSEDAVIDENAYSILEP